jgi:hypothetical protein
MTRTQDTARAVATAQRLANHEDRAYVVVHADGERPLIEPLALLALAGPLVVEFVAAGRALLVVPQGSHYGLSAAEIVAAESQAAR